MTLKWNWGTGIAIVYSIFAAGTLGFATFAMTQDVDLVSPEYYADAMAYDAKKIAVERAMALPFTAAIESDAAAGNRVLVISFPRAARPESGHVTLYRASDVTADRTIAIAATDLGVDGLFRTTMPALAAGPWTLQIRWTASGQAYYREQRVVVP